MTITSYESTPSPRIFLLSAIISIVFFQLLGEFVEAIYLFGLLGTEIPPEIGLVVLFFSPLLLIPFRKSFTTSIAVKIILSLVFLARSVEIMLPTQGRLIISGFGFAALMLFIPAYLSKISHEENPGRYTKDISTGVSLALFALVLTRALNSGSDLTSFGMYRIISWGIMGLGIWLTWQPGSDKNAALRPSSQAKPLYAYLYTLGLAGVIVLLFFVFTAPNIISRWGDSSNLMIHIILLGSWLLGTYLWLNNQLGPTNLIFGTGVVFVILLVLSIFPHQVIFPSDIENGYPHPAPTIQPWLSIAPYFLVALSPVLLLAFNVYLTRITNGTHSSKVLAGAFSLGSGFLLIMVLSQVFTTVYDYIPVIGPAFRDKYWIVFLVPGTLAFLPLLLHDTQLSAKSKVSSRVRSIWQITAGIFTLGSIVGLLIITAHPSPPDEKIETLRALTYNIQQGYDEQGERNFDGQLKYIRRLSPDIIGLQECDTARIAGGNTDVVAYFANHLNMYSYYGPSSVAGTFGIALLSRFPIENATTYYLYSDGEQVAVISAKINTGNETVSIFVTHLGNGGPMIQMQQMLELMHGRENMIAMGDFNFRPYEEQYAITIENYEDAYLIAKERTIPSTWGDEETFDIDERIDHIFVSSDIIVHYLEYLTQPESDHPALFVEIGW